MQYVIDHVSVFGCLFLVCYLVSNKKKGVVNNHIIYYCPARYATIRTLQHTYSFIYSKKWFSTTNNKENKITAFFVPTGKLNTF